MSFTDIDGSKICLNRSYKIEEQVQRSFKETSVKWIALFFQGCILFGNYYCYDNPQALETQMVSQLNISAAQFNLLYSIYALPNLILPFMGGFIIDHLGVRKGLILFSTLVVMGQILFTWGGYLPNFLVMLGGRLIYSLGGDCLTIAQNVIVSKWFEGKQLGFALAFSGNTTFGLTTAFNSYFTAKLCQSSKNLGFPLFIGSCVCLFSVICVIITVLLDIANEKIENHRKTVAVRSPSSLQRQNSLLHSPQSLHLKDVLYFGKLFWWLVINFSIMSAAFYTFTNNINDYYHSRFNINNDTAGLWITSVYLVLGLASPVCGYLVDLYGYRIIWIVASGFISLTTYVLLLLIPDCDGCYKGIIALITLGLFYASYMSTITPCIPLVLDKNQYGTGFGICFSAQNLMLLIFPIVGGIIIDQTDGTRPEQKYLWFTVFMAGFSVMGMLSGLVCGYYDRINGRILQKTVKGHVVRTISSLLLDYEYFTNLSQAATDVGARSQIAKTIEDPITDVITQVHYHE